jgi:hypothetical protein
MLYLTHATSVNTSDNPMIKPGMERMTELCAEEFIAQ